MSIQLPELEQPPRLPQPPRGASEKFNSFIKTTLLGGMVVLLPVAILITVFRWVYGLIQGAIRPLTQAVLARQEMQDFLAVLMVLGVIILACFIVGLIVRTQVGRFIHEQLESRILRLAPGYSLIKETVRQFLGRGESPFSSVAFVQLFDSDTMSIGFVTERHENGWFAVFVPTAPNPTSGLIYHLKPEHVHIVKHPVEDVMRSIISCGAGSAELMKKMEADRAGRRLPTIEQDEPPAEAGGPAAGPH